MLDDLREILGGMINRLSFIFGGPPSKLISSSPPSDGPWIFNLNVSRFLDTSDKDAETIDIANLAVTQTMKSLRTYGVDGIYPRGEHLTDLISNGIDFIESIRSAHSIDINNEVGAGNGACTEAFDRAFARWELDGGSSLTIPQVACLAGLDERTVRNAASKTGKGSLQTFNQDGTTCVRAETAYAWLSSKRGFVPTAYLDDSENADPMEFSTVAGFTKFLRWKREALELDVESAVKAAGHHHLNKEEWSLIENESKEPSLRFVPGIASALNVEEDWLTEKVMEVFYSRQLELVKASVTKK